jgi:5-methyltetrahydropteroyltriglutamate--homocysteine methyltransferase
MGRRIKTTTVGSYPVLPWLAGSNSRTTIRDALMVVLKAQELAGIDLITDGELLRFDSSNPESNGMLDYFVGQLGGVRKQVSINDADRVQTDLALGYDMSAAYAVVSDINEGTLNLPRDFDMVRKLTRSKLKFTCTGPHMLARMLTNFYYKDIGEAAMAVADVLRKQLELIDADTVQIDEAAIAGNPEDAAWAAAALNRVMEGVSGEKAVHICFGNFGGQSLLQGYWKNLLPYVNALKVDHLVLEFARRQYSELPVMNEVNPKIGLGIGVIDIKDNEVESPDLIASRIEKIVNTIGLDRLHYVHPDCGFWMLQRSVTDRKMRSLVEGRDLFEGRL